MCISKCSWWCCQDIFDHRDDFVFKVLVKKKISAFLILGREIIFLFSFSAQQSAVAILQQQQKPLCVCVLYSYITLWIYSVMRITFVSLNDKKKSIQDSFLVLQLGRHIVSKLNVGLESSFFVYEIWKTYKRQGGNEDSAKE